MNDPGAFAKLDELLLTALELRPKDRGAFLDKACPDPLLRAELESLIAASERSDAFDRPSVRVEPSNVTETASTGAVATSSGDTTEASPMISIARRFPPGAVLANRFQIIRFIARGAMGEVYEALDLELQEPVALKMLAPLHHIQDQQALQRFRREIHLARKVTHANICRIFDLFRHQETDEVGRTTEVTFLSMELLAGETLADHIIRCGPIAPADALPLVHQLAAGLDAAHLAGVIHRDFKPTNVILLPLRGENVRAVITDFGLARAIETAPALTQSGAFLGTPAYMAPEQVVGGEITAATDIYSLGVVLYELVTSRLPFTADTRIATAFKRLTEPAPSPRIYVPDLELAWEQVILRCLSRDPADRFKRATDVAEALGKPVDLQVPKELPIKPPVDRPGPLIAHTTHTATIDQRTGTALRGRFFRRSILVLGGMLTTAVFIALTVRGVANWRGRYTSPIRSLAVLPFVNVGGDLDWAYLSDGFTESMINRLSRIRDLTVMSRSAVFRLDTSHGDAIEQGRRLKVDAILTGSVRHFTDHLEASIELVECGTGRHLWGEVFRQSFLDSLSFESNAVEETATHVRGELNHIDKQRVARNYTDNVDAYRLYLKGRYEWNKRTFKGYEEAIRYFRQALDMDPGYALAYAGIADAYSNESGYRRPSEVFPRARAAADKALEIDPELAEAHTSLGNIDVLYDWDWAQAEREFRLALQLNPNYPSAHSMFARLLEVLGRFSEAEVEVAKGQQIDPLSLGIANGVGFQYYLARDFPRAERHFRSYLTLDPNPRTASYLALTQVALGRAADAVAGYEGLLTADPSDLNTMADLVRAYALAGRYDDAARLYEKLKIETRQPSLLPTSVAAASAAIGQTDEAFAELNRAYFEKCWYLIFLRVEPIFDPLRNDERYRVLLKNMKLGE